MPMGIRSRIVKALFADVLHDEISQAAGRVFSHVEGLRPDESVLLAKAAFSKRGSEVEKSSRQVVGQMIGINSDEGILPDIDFEIFNQVYEQTSWVRAVVGVICKAVTARGWMLAPTSTEADPKNAEILSEFFLNCNPNDTFLEILDDITRDEYVFGNAFLEIVKDATGKPVELWNLDATSMRVKADEHARILGYAQVPRSYAAGSGTSVVSFDSNEIIHFKLGTKGATLYGLSPLVSLILPITVDKFAQIYNRAFFLNGAKIRGAFIMKDATPEQVERNREYLQARAKNPDMAHSDLVLEGQVEFKQIGVNQKDMEFLQLREFTRGEVLAVYGVPPSKISIIETGNIGAGTGEHQDQTFYEETIIPHQKRVAEKITKHIIRNGFGIRDWTFQFSKRSIDEKEQAEIYDIYMRNGVYTPDEVRRIVSPRMPELEKRYRRTIEKGVSKRRQALGHATQAVIAVENRFKSALARLFREIGKKVIARLPDLKKKGLPAVEPGWQGDVRFEMAQHNDLLFKKWIGLRLAKEFDDLQVILEVIDEDEIARILQRYSLDAARKGFDASVQRDELQDLDDISLRLEEKIKANSIDLAKHISTSLKDSIRQSLLDGLAASETIPQLARRIQEGLDRVSVINVRAVTDEEGNILRSATTREISSETLAELIARTEANRSFNDGNLDALRQASVETVRWLLAPDACPECVDASSAGDGQDIGKSLSLEEAAGQIPVHPNCRCTWITEVPE
jgi:HK97 family phage portal protein